MAHHVKPCQDRTPQERSLNLRIHIMIFVLVNCGHLAQHLKAHSLAGNSGCERTSAAI